MIIENKLFLRQRFPHILNLLEKEQTNEKVSPIRLVETKSGDKTIEVMSENRINVLHSKYNPQKEAERLIDQYADDIDNYEHVLFYGIGLGYHIKEFLNRYPHFTFSIYEPNKEIFQLFIQENNLTRLPVQNLKHLFVDLSSELEKNILEEITVHIRERILFIVLPSYQQIFQEKCKRFAEHFRRAVQSKRQGFYVDYQFSSRWTLNSLMNFPKTVQTPNILDEEFKDRFQNKPVIIVSAGPSLEDDYEHLRYIKENKLAYIFAVGSANRALIAQNIMPDAVCTYDPQAHNYLVFETMIEKGITDVPIIYGTSVGFETLDMYQGPKLHVIISQDTLAPYYLKRVDGKAIEGVYDSPTIAAVAFQLAAKLGVNPIIFAGQNLAYRNNQYYAKDVNYSNQSDFYKKNKNVLLVEDVYGNKIETTPSFNNMRENIETRIRQYPGVEVYNTTKGGAAIKGTVFIPIEELIKSKLTRSVVDEDWYKGIENKYDKQYLLQQITRMEQSIEKFRNHYKDVQGVLKDIQKGIEAKNGNKIAKLTVKLDKFMKKLTSSECYETYILPMNRNHYEALNMQIANIRKQTNEVEKAKLILKAFVPYLERCKDTLEVMAANIYNIHWEVHKKLTRYSYQFYSSDCGVFQYEGNWKKEIFAIEKTMAHSAKRMSAKGNVTLRFRFTGTLIRILGSKRKDGSNKIQITIDGKTEIFTARNVKCNEDEVSKTNQVLYEKSHLENKEHFVEISILDGQAFSFTGVDIDKGGRLYHVDEVIHINDLEIGKRIRCHYKASFNKIGEFKNLGEETGEFIPSESEAIPDGDFYFVMVDEADGRKKLIADRNVQHSISWDTLFEHGMTDGKEITISGNKVFMRLMDGGRAFIDQNGEPSMVNQNLGAWPKDNEWDKYVNEKFLVEGVSSWCRNTAIVGLQNRFNIGNGFETNILTEESVKIGKVLRGNINRKYLMVLNKKVRRPTEGFRPLIIM